MFESLSRFIDNVRLWRVAIVAVLALLASLQATLFFHSAHFGWGFLPFIISYHLIRLIAAILFFDGIIALVRTTSARGTERQRRRSIAMLDIVASVGAFAFLYWY